MTASLVLNDKFPGRVIVSEDRLGPLLRKHPGCDQPASALEAIDISAEQIDKIVERWRNAVARQAALLRKHAAGTLESLPTGCLYEDLNRPEWRQAALACEVLRHPSVSKNSGWLDTRVLQARFAEAAHDDAPVRMLIGWGQPKRDAGGLKAAGPFADLAETYAVARIGIVARAIATVLSHPVQVIVLSGGERFRPAFFTAQDLCRQYDEQRQRIADDLCGPGAIAFMDYVQQLTSEQSRERELHYRAAVERVSDEMIAGQFDAVLMNIDWRQVFGLALGGEAPHGHVLPSGVRQWATGCPPGDLILLIRAALCSVVTPRRQADWQQFLRDTEDVVQDTVAFVRAVAWDSTRKYIALQAADCVLDETADGLVSSVAPIRLTVHQKRDRPDIPAIFTLGPAAGDVLSQHVMARLDASGRAHFEPLAEIQMHSPRPVEVRTSPNQHDAALFDWLGATSQPLCFIEATNRDAVDLLGSVLEA